MTQNPFDEPGEQERTVIRPAPGGSRAAVRAPSPASPAPSASPSPPTPEIETVATGTTPLATAAAPLIQLLGRLRNTATAPDPGDMRERTRRELRAFEKRAKEAGIPIDQTRLASYALCAALDDVVLNTPWGSHGRWRDEPLAVALHKDDQAGAGFFDQLRTLRTTLPTGKDVVEIMFICLSLGMMGPYRASPEGAQQLERVRHQVFGMIKPAAAAPGPLSIDTAPVAVPRPPRGGVPVWVVASAVLGLLAALYVYLLTSLNSTSDAFYQEALAAPPTAMPALVRPAATPPPPPPPAPPEPDAAARLQAALADVPGIEIIGTPAAAIIRIPAAKLFTTNATVAPGPLLDRVAKAIGAEPGPIRVVGYTDNQPPRTVAFPSKFALSNAQAAAIRTALAKQVPNPSRITSEGRADADPLAPNTTPEARERNRRVEIVIPRAP